jgi:CrcB protein
VGSFVIGFVGALAAPDPDLRLFLMVGFCGGYTTVSSFALQTLNLAREGEWRRALGNVLGSTGLCLVSVWLGQCVGLALDPTEVA